MASVTKAVLGAGMLTKLFPKTVETYANSSAARKQDIERRAQKLITEIESYGFEVHSPGT